MDPRKTRQITNITGHLALYLNWLEKDDFDLYLKKLRCLLDLTSGTKDKTLEEYIKTDSNIEYIFLLFSIEGLRKVLDLDEDQVLEVTLDEVNAIARKKIEEEILNARAQSVVEKPPVMLTINTQLAQQLSEITYERMPILSTLDITQERWDQIQTLIRPILITDDDQNQLKISVPEKFAEKLQGVLKLHQDQVALRTRAANVNSNIQAEEMAEFVRKTTIEKLQALLALINAADIPHLFGNEKNLKQFLNNYMEAGEIYCGYLGDVSDSALQERYGVQITEAQFRAYGDQFLNILFVRYSVSKDLSIRENNIDYLEDSVNEIAKIFSIILPLEQEYPHTTTPMYVQIRNILYHHINRMICFSFIASMSPLSLDQSTDTLQERIMRTSYRKGALLLQRLCDVESRSLDTETFPLRLLALYHAAGDRDGCEKMQELIRSILQRDVIHPFEEFNQALAQVTGEPDVVVENKSLDIREFFQERHELLDILREIRAKGMDNEKLAELHWSMINLLLTYTVEKIRLHTWQLINLYTKSRDGVYDEGLQDSINKTYEKLCNDLKYLNGINPDLSFKFFEGLSFSDKYRPAYSEHILSIITTVSNSVAQLEMHEAIEMEEQLLRELQRLKHFYQQQFEKPLLKSPINREEVFRNITHLAQQCEQLTLTLLRILPDTMNINELAKLYKDYAQVRLVHKELIKRIPINETALLYRLRYVMDFFQIHHTEINNLIGIYFERAVAQYQRTKNFDDYDSTMRAYYLLHDLNIPLRLAFPTPDKEHHLDMDLTEMLDNCINKLLKAAPDVLDKICDHAKSLPPLPADSSADDDAMEIRRKMYQQTANLFMDCARYIYADYEREDTLNDLFISGMGVRLCRAILLYDSCSDFKNSEMVQATLSKWLRVHLFEPTMTQLNYKVSIEDATPGRIRSQAISLFKEIQTEQNAKRALFPLQVLAQIRKTNNNPEFTDMHMRLAFKYLDRCCEAYLDGPAISYQDELEEVSNAFKEVYKQVFQSLFATDESKMHFIQIGHKAIKLLAEQQRFTMESKDFMTCMILDVHINDLINLLLENPPFYNLDELVIKDEGLVKSIRSLRINSKLRASESAFYYGEYGSAQGFAEAAIKLIRAELEVYSPDSPVRAQLTLDLKQVQERLTTIMALLNRNRRQRDITSLKDSDEFEPKVPRK